MEKISCSCTCGTGSINHNFNSKCRKTQKHIDSSRTQDNIVLKNITPGEIENEFNKIFESDVKAYNAKQKQNCRKIKSYYQKCCKDKKITAPYRELIYQVGNKEDARDPEKYKKMVESLKKFYMEFETTYKRLKVIGAVIHLDEATPHLHIDVVPYADGGKKGLAHKVNFEKAVEQMGFLPEFSDVNKKEKAKPLVFNGFRNHSMELLNAIMQREGLERAVQNNIHNHLTTEEFKLKQEEINKVKKEVAQKYAESNGNQAVSDLLEINTELEKENGNLKKTIHNLKNRLKNLCTWIAKKIFNEDFDQKLTKDFTKNNDTKTVEEVEKINNEMFEEEQEERSTEM